MEAVYDTEMETVEDAVSSEVTQTSIENDTREDVLKKSVDSVKNPIYVESTEDGVIETEIVEDADSDISLADLDASGTYETVVLADSNEPKTFDQAGFEIIMVFMLAFIAGLLLWDMLSKRWHI